MSEKQTPEPRTADMPPGLFDAPCLWCAYNGAGYWMAGTHDLNCPWFRIGGHNERRMALADVIRKQAKSDHDEPSPDPIDPTLGPELGLGHSGRFIPARKPAPAQGQAALVRLNVTPLDHDTEGDPLAVPEGTDVFLEGRGIAFLLNLSNGATATYSLIVDKTERERGTVKALSASPVAPPSEDVEALVEETMRTARGQDWGDDISVAEAQFWECAIRAALFQSRREGPAMTDTSPEALLAWLEQERLDEPRYCAERRRMWEALAALVRAQMAQPTREQIEDLIFQPWLRGHDTRVVTGYGRAIKDVLRLYPAEAPTPRVEPSK